MERRYSEISLKKRRFGRGIMLAAAILILGRLFTGTSGEFIKSILAAGIDQVLPSLFKYQECEEEETEVPVWIRVFAPSVFAFTWQEESDSWFLEENGQEELGTVLVQGKVDVQTQDEEDLHEPGIYISVSRENELSLLQENIFQDGSSFSEESVPNPFEGNSFSAESFLQTDGRSVLKNYDFSLYHDMTQLIKDFYIVDSSTTPNEALLDIDKLTG